MPRRQATRTTAHEYLLLTCTPRRSLQVTVIPSGLFNVGFWNRTFRMVDEGAIAKCTMSGAGLEGAVAGELAELQIVTKQVVGEDIPGR
jgi:hypothetical protein